MNPVIPAAVTAALNALATDYAGLQSLYGNQSAASIALAVAQNSLDTATSAITSAVSQFNSDQQALFALIQSTYTTAPPAAPVSPPTASV